MEDRDNKNAKDMNQALRRENEALKPSTTVLCLGAVGGGEGAEGRRASNFRGTDLRRYLRRFAPSKIASNIKVPSKVPTL